MPLGAYADGFSIGTTPELLGIKNGTSMEEGERVELGERNSRQTIWQSDGGSRRIAKIGGLMGRKQEGS